MKNARWYVLASVCILVSLALSLPVTAAEKEKKRGGAHWTVIICSSRASSITLIAGPSKDDNDAFATWKPKDGQRTFVLPERIQHLGEVYFKAEAPDKLPVELCVLYDGHRKKRFGFDRGDEDHFVKASDNDDDNCRCQ